MSFLTRLFGKGKKKLNLEVTKLENKEPEQNPKDTGTTLRKQKDPELTAPEMAQMKDWEIKTLPEWKSGDVIMDTYEVENVISGGMGHVYIANHNKWNVKLAIKSPNEMMLSDKDFFARILREANAWTELGLHPNIAYCYYVRNIENVPHIIVEYVDGGNLREWIEDGKCIDYRTNLNLAIQFCHGMEHAHSKGMIHRDIKPENILMTKDGILKITDFGLVSGQNKGIGNPTPAVKTNKGDPKIPAHGLTTLGTRMGTEGYMAPEQEANARDVDERADIFSFGICLYEMFCGGKPYRNKQSGNIEPDDPVALSKDENFPSSISDVLKKCVQWNPANRFNTFKEIRQIFSNIYFQLYGEKSLYCEMEMVDEEASGLNNKGVSYFELGKEEESLSCWKKAVEINPTHLEATFNLSLIQWRAGNITDTEVLKRLDNCSNNPEIKQEKIAELKAFIYQEGINPEAAKKALIYFPGKYDTLFPGNDKSRMKNVCIMKGHTDSVLSLAITPDSRYVVSGSQDKTLKIWDLMTDQCIRTMQGHTDAVNAVAIIPDGRHVVSGGADAKLKFWKIDTGQCVKTIDGEIGPIKVLAITMDGKHVVYGGADKTLRVLDFETDRTICIMEGHTKSIISLAITPDGKYALSGGWNYPPPLRMWDLKMGQSIRVLKGHKKHIHSLAITSDGRYAVSGSEDYTLRVWELKTGRCVKIMEGHTKSIRALAITPDGRYVFSGTQNHYGNNSVRLWELETGKALRSMKWHALDINSLDITPNGKYAVSGSLDKTLKLWKLDFEKTYRSEYLLSKAKGFKETKEDENLLNLAVSEAKELFDNRNYKDSYSILYNAWKERSFCNKEIIIRLYSKLMAKARIGSLYSYYQIREINGHTSTVNTMVITPDGRYAISGSGVSYGTDNTLRMWELETGQCVRIMEGHTKPVLSLAMTHDGRYVISGSEDYTLRMWELKSGRCVYTMEGHERSVSSLAITPDDRYIVSAGSYDRTLRLWDLDTGQSLLTMEGHSEMITSLAITPDGSRAVSGSFDKELRVWDIATGQCLRIMKGHKNYVLSLAITPDGRYAISVSKEWDTPLNIWVWELETGRCIRTMEWITKGDEASLATLTSNGRYAIAGEWGDILKVWDIETGQCITTLRGGAPVPITSLAITSDSQLAVTGHFQGVIRVWRFIWNLEFD